MDQGRRGSKRLRKTLMRVLLVASVAALSAGAAAAQVVTPVPISAPEGDRAEAVFRDLVWEPVVQAKCVKCHVADGVSGHTRLVFDPDGDAAAHLQTFADFLEAAGDDHDHDHLHGHELILVKIQGAGHGGGVQVAAGSEDFDNMDRFLALLEEKPQGFVARLLAALDDAETPPLTFAITTPMDADTVAGSAVAVSATGAPTEAVHFAYRLRGGSPDGFDYLGAAVNRGAARYVWDTAAMMDGDYVLAALYAEDEGASVTHDAIEVTVDNDPAADADVVEAPGRKEQAVRTDAVNEVVTAGGVMLTLPPGALDADDRLTLTVTDTPDAATAPGDPVGTGVDIALDSGQSTFRAPVAVALPYPEGRPDGLVHRTDIPETELSLWYFDADADAWERVAGSTVRAEADLVTADVTQTGAYGIFHAPMRMAERDVDDAMPPDLDDTGGGGGGCAMLPMVPPGGPPDDPTLVGLLALATVYLLFGRRRLRRQAATG